MNINGRDTQMAQVRTNIIGKSQIAQHDDVPASIENGVDAFQSGFSAKYNLLPESGGLPRMLPISDEKNLVAANWWAGLSLPEFIASTTVRPATAAWLRRQALQQPHLVIEI